MPLYRVLWGWIYNVDRVGPIAQTFAQVLLLVVVRQACLKRSLPGGPVAVSQSRDRVSSVCLLCIVDRVGPIGLV